MQYNLNSVSFHNGFKIRSKHNCNFGIKCDKFSQFTFSDNKRTNTLQIFDKINGFPSN